jgi:hypothetical protein
VKRLLLTLLFVSLLAPLAYSQVCTPVEVSRNYSIRDDGGGPYFFFNFNGTEYAAGTTPVYLSGGNNLVEPFRTQGYVNVFALWGGCQKYWSWEYQSRQTLVDNTTNKVVWSTPLNTGAAHYCGFVGSCAYNLSDIRSGNFYFNFLSGHHYTFYSYMDAWVLTVGFSLTYWGSIPIVVN